MGEEPKYNKSTVTSGGGAKGGRGLGGGGKGLVGTLGGGGLGGGGGGLVGGLSVDTATRRLTSPSANDVRKRVMGSRTKKPLRKVALSYRTFERFSEWIVE